MNFVQSCFIGGNIAQVFRPGSEPGLPPWCCWSWEGAGSQCQLGWARTDLSLHPNAELKCPGLGRGLGYDLLFSFGGWIYEKMSKSA